MNARHEKVKSILKACEKLDVNYQVRYMDYEKDQFTIPVKITKDRIEQIAYDCSIAEIKIIIEP